MILISARILQPMKQISNFTPTIYDVAKLCGVSRRTVDRVIYERGRVSQATKEKVCKAIKELGYTPNPVASTLAKRKEYKFACLLPKYEEGDYWDEIHKGFIEGIESVKYGSIVLDIYNYDTNDADSFISASRDILKSSPSGVVMNVVFKEAVIEFTTELSVRGIPYAYVSNMIADDKHVIYYGVDLYKSGELGACLLTMRCKVKDVALIRLIRDSKHESDPNASRRHGFINYIKTNFPDCNIHTIFINPNQPEEILKTLEDFFSKHPHIKHVGVTNSRIWLIDEYLRLNPDPDRIVVGFDDLKKNLECLKNGHIDFLVTRHISQQSINVITNFAECIIRGIKPNIVNNYVHQDILHKHNLDDY